VEMVCFPAIAERDEYIGPKLTRRAGEALFPAVKPLEFLHERRQLMGEPSWQSEYQQHPIVVGGGIFPIEKIGVQPMWDWHNLLRSVRYWDKAGTEDGGAYTAGVLLHQTRDKQFVISHVTRGQWGALERERQIKAWAERDTANIKTGSYEVVVEQEPGSGGKESAENTIRNLAGYRVFADRVTGSKEARAEPLAAQVQGGNVKLCAASWNSDFLAEMEIFPQGKYRDQCDAASGAFNRIAIGPAYSLNSGWLD
jgi:predicted phage terminase large subunit-like protein